jgi:hypothetical protein
MHGILQKKFKITCGKCLNYHMYVDANSFNEREFRKIIKDKGWNKVKSIGWICPNCN